MPGSMPRPPVPHRGLICPVRMSDPHAWLKCGARMPGSPLVPTQPACAAYKSGRLPGPARLVPHAWPTAYKSGRLPGPHARAPDQCARLDAQATCPACGPHMPCLHVRPACVTSNAWPAYPAHHSPPPGPHAAYKSGPLAWPAACPYARPVRPADASAPALVRPKRPAAGPTWPATPPLPPPRLTDGSPVLATVPDLRAAHLPALCLADATGCPQPVSCLAHLPGSHRADGPAGPGGRFRRRPVSAALLIRPAHLRLPAHPGSALFALRRSILSEAGSRTRPACRPAARPAPRPVRLARTPEACAQPRRLRPRPRLVHAPRSWARSAGLRGPCFGPA